MEHKTLTIIGKVSKKTQYKNIASVQQDKLAGNNDEIFIYRVRDKHARTHLENPTTWHKNKKASSLSSL
ncbi:MAG: hypothetical protein ACTILG_14530 [Sphingobacterium sp.]